MASDEFFIKKTLFLAKKGLGWTNPNPMVGALIVKNSKIIGEGFHHKYGFAHAEIEALKSCRSSPKGSTLYVNLEPCNHFGKTPPCLDAIIKSQIKRVVICTLDPNAGGSSVAKLKKTGISVSVGLLKEQAQKLNEAFFTFHQKKRPFIAIKFASSLDGKIATKTNDSKWITNEKARKYARFLRAEYQAILVGINTIVKDNPNLGARKKGKRDPLRIILDSTLKIPPDSNVLRDTNVLIATGAKSDKKKQKILEQRGISIVTFEEKDGIIPLQKLLKELQKREIISVLVEGGSLILGSFLDIKLVDKVYAFYAPILVGGEKAITAIGGKGVKTISESLHLKDLSYKQFDDNFLISGYPE